MPPTILRILLSISRRDDRSLTLPNEPTCHFSQRRPEVEQSVYIVAEPDARGTCGLALGRPHHISTESLSQ